MAKLSLSLGSFNFANTFSLGACRNPFCLGQSFGFVAGIAGAFGDQDFLAFGELNLSGKLVFGDRPLILNRHCSPLKGGLIGLLLESFKGRGLQGALELAAWRQIGKTNAHNLDTDLSKAGLARQVIDHNIAQRINALIEKFAHLGFRKVIKRGLGSAPADPAFDAVDRITDPTTGARGDGEVDAVCCKLWLARAPADDTLKRYILKVRASSLDKQGHLPVVQGNFGKARIVRQEPEHQSAPALAKSAIAIAQDVLA